MRWPWVNRLVWDQQVDLTNHHINAYNSLAEEYNNLDEGWSTRYETLLEKYHALKMAGASPPPAYPDYIDQPKTVDEVDEERALKEQG